MAGGTAAPAKLARLATAVTGVGIWEWDVFTTEICWSATMVSIFGVTPPLDGIVPYGA